MSACGDSSKSQSAKTTAGGSKNLVTTTVKSGGAGSTSGGQTGGTSPVLRQNHTPYSYGQSTYPAGGIGLEYNVDANARVFAEGDMELDHDFGYGNCQILKGKYVLSTQNAGQQKTMVHHYGGITLSATGPKALVFTITNVLAVENQNGRWVQKVDIDLVSVGGQACSHLKMFFAMPLAN